MSFKMRQVIITGIAGLASATSIAYFTIQSGSSKFTTNYSQNQKLDSNLVSVVSKYQLKSSYLTSNSSDLLSQKSSPVVITPPTSGCQIDMAIVDDPEAPLNVRNSPEVTEDNIISQLNNNTFVSVADEKSGWLQITNPVTGWVAKNRTRSSCAKVDQTITFSPEGDIAIVKGEIIGTGSHNYRVRMLQGQTLTIRNLGDAFPAIISPDGQLMTREPNVEGQESEWAGIIPVSGVYTLQLDSNFRGFEYQFLVQIEDNGNY